MPPSRKCQSSRTNPPVSLQEGRLGQQKRNLYDEQWNARFKELLDYRSQHGDCNVPQKHGTLGTWVTSQRSAYRDEKLAQDRIDRLNSIGFKWTLKEGGPKVPWETRFNELVQYKAKHGDCNIPRRQGQLGDWVSKQRIAYRDDKLEQDRIDRLNGIGFDWAPLRGSARTRPWETRFNELVKYKAKRGGCNVPRRQGPLGRWVHHQRESYKKNRLSKDSIDRLNGIGFDWKCARTSSWEIQFNELINYKAKHGDCNVLSSLGKLGRWVHEQRKKYKKNKLAQDRIDRLNCAGFDWTPPRGGSRKKSALPGSQIQLLLRKEKVPITNVESLSIGDKAMVVEPDRVEGEGYDSEPSLPLQIPSNPSIDSLGTENEDEDDEIGAWIYDQVVQQRQVSMRRRTRSSMKRKGSHFNM